MNAPTSPLVFGPYDQAALDLQYNNRARCPDAATYMARFPQSSARVRAELGGELDLAYGPGPRDRLDLFRPKGLKNPSVVIFIHGGYWHLLDKQVFGYLARPWVRAGAAFAALGYPLCPGVTMTNLVASVRAGVAWLAAEAGSLGLDRGRMLVTGHSAGGHLTAMSATGPGPDLVGAVALSGLYDLEPIQLTYLNASLRMSPDEAKALSPIHLPRPGARAGRVILNVGSAESEEYHRHQDALGATWDVETRSLAGLHHFSIVDTLADQGHPLFRTVAELLRL